MSEAVHAKLCDLARAEIEALAEAGIACTPDDVVLLNALAWKVETPTHRMALSRGAPVFAGSVALWPMTLASESWWQRAIEGTGRESRQTALLAFAMAHSRQQDALDAIDPATAYKQADAWSRRLPCRRGELMEAISQVLAQDDNGPSVRDPKAEAGAMPPGQMVSVLVSAAGGPPEMWERQVAIGYLREQFQAANAQMAAEQGGSLRDSDMVHATRQLGLAVEAIRQRNRDSARGES